jgi:hypothetical protein
MIFKKRINTELNSWKQYGEYEIIELSKQIIIKFKMDNIEIICNDTYPFKAPEMSIRGVNYNEYLARLQSDNDEYIKNKLNIECLCCSSLLCPNNWRPGIKITDVINQYIKFRDLFFV